MGTRGIEILKLDVKELLNLLNRALADEWLAYYQYWVGSKIAVGPMREDVVKELLQHASDELRHADLLAERITQLGGTPLLDPAEWKGKTNCGYEVPLDPDVRKLLEQNIKGEQCAISVYNNIMEFTSGKDLITHQIAFEIMRDEVEHEDDLEGLQEDIGLI